MKPLAARTMPLAGLASLLLLAVSSTQCRSGGDSGNDGGDLVACTPRVPLGNQPFYSPSALPSGPCTSEDKDCVLGVQEPCPCVGAKGPVNGYLCACRTGTWSCAVRDQGGGFCDCRADAAGDAALLDAGADAGG